MNLVDLGYVPARRFPPDERFALTAQLRRALVSIPANIAEGWGRGSTREYLQFLRIARGSLCEVETLVMIARRQGYISKPDTASFLDVSGHLGRMLLGLTRRLKGS
jgi:four helix bundle protein